MAAGTTNLSGITHVHIEYDSDEEAGKNDSLVVNAFISPRIAEKPAHSPRLEMSHRTIKEVDSNDESESSEEELREPIEAVGFLGGSHGGAQETPLYAEKAPVRSAISNFLARIFRKELDPERTPLLPKKD